MSAVDHEAMPQQEADDTIHALQKRWRNLINGLGHPVETAKSDALMADLIDRHEGPLRHYHDMTHVLAVLETLDALHGGDATGVPPASALAAWFHDAVYDPTAPSGHNEQASAELCEDHLRALGIASEVTDAASALVRATSGHHLNSEVDGCDRFLDADLAILGAAPPRYSRYAQQIRAEYAHIPESDYRVGRSRILEDFLNRPRLFFSAQGHDRFDEAARINLAAELDQLRS